MPHSLSRNHNLDLCIHMLASLIYLIVSKVPEYIQMRFGGGGVFWDKSSRLHNLKYIYLERTLSLHTRFRWTKEYDTIGWFIYQMSNQENASIWSVAMFFIWYKINGEKLWPAQVNLQRITWSDYNNIKGMIILISLSNVLYVSTNKDEKLHFILFKRNGPREIF